MKVEEVMTERVITVDKNRSLSDAVNLLEKKRISRVVVTTNGELCGMLTEKDVADTIGSSRHGKSSPSSLHISTAMNSSLVTIENNASVEKAAKTMVKKGISSLPVFKDGKLAGIVTKTDLVKTLKDSDEKLEGLMKINVTCVSPNDRIVHARRTMLDNKIGRVVAVDEGDIVGILTGMGAAKVIYAFKQVTERSHSSRIRNILVDEAMTPKVITLDIKAEVKDALAIMTKNKFSGIPLTRDGKLAGIVTKTDMLKIVK